MPARYAAADLKRVFWGLMCHLGTPLPQNTTGEILAEVKDETGTGAAVAAGTARARSRSTGPLRWHTDKCDLLSLLCASNGIEGGVSRIVSTVAIQDAMAARCPDLLAVLYEDFWRARPADEEGEGMAARPFPMPVFARGPDGDFTSQYSRTYVELAQGQPGVPPLTPQQVEAMDMLAAVAEELCIEMPFAPGADPADEPARHLSRPHGLCGRRRRAAQPAAHLAGQPAEPGAAGGACRAMGRRAGRRAARRGDAGAECAGGVGRSGREKYSLPEPHPSFL